AKNNFFRRNDLCFYWCNGSVIAKDDIPTLYAELFATDFLSTYATTQPWDDFADSLAYFVMDKNLATTYVIKLDNGDQYDITKKLHSKVFAKKYKYLQDFVNRDDIIYP